MNLAQAVDINRVWARFAERVAPETEPAAAPPPPRAKQPGIAKAIRAVLAAAARPLTVSQIAAQEGRFTAYQIGVNITSLRIAKHVKREGNCGAYRYRLSARGRAHL